MLVHERIDYGLAVIAWIIANANSKRRLDFRKFLPPWYDTAQDPEAGIARLFAMAEENERSRADDLDAHR